MENQATILDESFSSKTPENYENASKGQRFANYIIDIIIFYLFIGVASFVLETIGSNFINSVFIYAFFVLYYFILEFATGGKTLGKVITKTQVISENGENLTPKAFFIRSISRLVPFEAFSAFSSDTVMWHDKWAKTRVVKKG